MTPITHRRSSGLAAVALALGLTVLAAPVSAQRFKDRRFALDELTFAKTELRISRTLIDADQLPKEVWDREELARFRSDHGASWHVVMDERTGRVDLLDGGAIPFIPGPANSLRWRDFDADCEQISCMPLSTMESLARAFLKRSEGLIKVNPEELVLDPAGSVPVGDSVFHLRFQWVYHQLPVEGGSVFFTINNGNLIQVGMQGIGEIRLDPRPTISVRRAWKVLGAYVGGVSEKDEVIDEGTLFILPITPKRLDPDALEVPFGKGIDYALVYKLVFRRPGVLGSWEGLVDAHTGELLRFRDSNIYGDIRGGVYKTDAPQTEVSAAFPFADWAPGAYADASGHFSAMSGTSTMVGPPSGTPGGVAISDACGSISLASNSAGLIDFGTGTGTNCTTPGFGGAGNTHAARTQYWNVTEIKKKGSTYLPSNTWLKSRLTDNVNISSHCNAYWSPSVGDVNFFESGDYTPWGSTTVYTCANTGELPGVSLHEWGHGMDSNDGSGSGTDNRPVEARADWTALLQTRQSCVGNGFYLNITPLPSTGLNCSGNGNPCTACTGVRDVDSAAHTNTTPWTPQNKGTVWGTTKCSSGSYVGPCGWEDHCESGIATQALWDFVNRDLTSAPTSLSSASAWQLADRLFYAGMPSSTDMYTCTGTTTKVSSGCGTGSLYTVMRAIDDDGDGTANGTPHAAAIFAALNRHGIACGAASDPTNQNHTSCPALSTPTLAATASSHQITLTWTSGGASATRYFVYRNETGCNTGFTRIATVAAPTLTYTDSAVLHGQTYHYRVQAATANDSCVSPVGNCVSIAAGLAADKDFYVSDWNTSPSTYDHGTEPSSGPNWAYSSDVWNRATNSPGSPNASGWYATDNMQAGAGALGDNYAFVRVRRNAAGSAASVTAHFFVSPFGTGSSFVDAGSGADPVLSFATGELEKTLSSGYHWHQNATSSVHACLAVQISSADDPYATPSLLGRTPGPDDYLVSDDNNKAQRNLLVSNNPFHFAGLAFALIHNSALFPRDVVLRFEFPDIDRFRKARIELVGGEAWDLRSGSTVTLEHMQPGENRWVAIRHQIDRGTPVPINVFELDRGKPVNGFTVLAQAVPLGKAIQENLRSHVQVFNRLAAAFDVKAGLREARAAHRMLQGREIPWSAYRGFLKRHRRSMRAILDSLSRMGPREDPFGVMETFEALGEATSANRPEQAASEHAMLLSRLDALATMLQKTGGDTADILQMVRWQEALYRSRPALRRLGCSDLVVETSQAFIRTYGRGGIERYPELLKQLASCFHVTARALDGDRELLEDAARAMESNRHALAALEKAHREFLLALQDAAGSIREE
ncbi:MAG: fibronectin type III domain-containing protein [Acidobacteria bacterium]|nr:fibronectin type III domain-containing protein [Acidobacteriota bacterium]